MSASPPESVEEAAHLEVEPYEEIDRVLPPDWYDDSINIGDQTNAEAKT